MVHFGEFLKTWSLRSNSVTRHVSFNRTKIGGKCQNSNATFWVIFKKCEQLDIVHVHLLGYLRVYPKSNVIFAMFVYFLLILNSGYSIWIFGFRKKQEAFPEEELPILTSSKVSSWLIAAKSNLMTRLDWAIFGEVDSCSVLLFVEELLLVSSSEVPIPSSGKAPSSPASKDSFLYYFPLMIACLIFYPPLS